MGKFIKTFDVHDTQVAVYKDIRVNATRTQFTPVVVAVTEMPHDKDKKVFSEKLILSQIACSDEQEQEIIFQKYNIDDAGRLVQNVRAKYTEVIEKKSNILLPGDLRFNMPIDR